MVGAMVLPARTSSQTAGGSVVSAPLGWIRTDSPPADVLTNKVPETGNVLLRSNPDFSLGCRNVRFLPSFKNIGEGSPLVKLRPPAPSRRSAEIDDPLKWIGRQRRDEPPGCRVGAKATSAWNLPTSSPSARSRLARTALRPDATLKRA